MDGDIQHVLLYTAGAFMLNICAGGFLSRLNLFIENSFRIVVFVFCQGTGVEKGACPEVC